MDIKEACKTVSTLANVFRGIFFEFEVHAKEGSVRVRGALSNMREAGEIRRVATGVPGVVALNLDELASPVRA